MDFLELAKARYSERKFCDKKVEDEKIKLILEAGRIAPTAKNYQPQFTYVVKSEEGLKKMNEVSPCIYGAPVVLLVCTKKDVVWHSATDETFNSIEVDASIVCTHMMLEAKNLGLESCWVLRFDKKKAIELFNIPENILPICVLDIGYTENGQPSPRHLDKKPLEEMYKIV